MADDESHQSNPAPSAFLPMAATAGGGEALPPEVDGDALPLQRLTVVFSIDLHPSRTLDHVEAVHDELNSRLMR